MICFPTSANGFCVIEPRLISGSDAAHASLQEVAAAARTVIDRCVNMMPSQGGKARKVGELETSAPDQKQVFPAIDGD